MEKGGIDGVDEGEAVDAVEAAVGLDEGGPFAELGTAGQERGLQAVEGRVGVLAREVECGGESGGRRSGAGA